MERTDDFTRPNSTAALGTPSDGGSAWSALGGVWGINSDQGYAVTSFDPSTAVLQSAESDVAVTATVGTYGSNAGVIVRAADANNYLVAFVNAGSCSLFSKVGGSFTSLGSAATTLTAGDQLTVTTKGATIAVTLNLTTIITATSTAGQLNTLHGLWCRLDTATRWSRFQIRPWTPPTTTRFLLPGALTYAIYSPATGTSLSSLKIFLPSGTAGSGSSGGYVALILKDAAADEAVTYFDAQTPPSLQF